MSYKLEWRKEAEAGKEETKEQLAPKSKKRVGNRRKEILEDSPAQVPPVNILSR